MTLVILGPTLKITKGDDYAASNSQSLTFSITSRTDLIGTKAHLRIESVAEDACVSLVIASGTQTITMGDMLAMYTNKLSCSKLLPYQLRFINPSGLIITVMSGTVKVTQGI